MAGWSKEVRVLVSPAAAFRELSKDTRGGWWVLMRRPLLLAFVFGCEVSLQASGRLSARLIADGVVSFAFVPVCSIAALAVVYRRGLRTMPFARAVDLFFSANGPWLMWFIAFGLLRSFETVRQAGAMPRGLLWSIEASLGATALWSVYIDRQFFREAFQRSDRASLGDVIFHRAISMPCATLYFFGIAGWAYVVWWTGL
jgi:hypothetical protein